MKRIGTIGVVITLVSAATAALAGCCTSSYPSGVQQEIPLSQEFSKMDTSAAQQVPSTYPAPASQQDRYRNHSACAVYTPEWPYSVPGG
jgi:hypothetical protein